MTTALSEVFSFKTSRKIILFGFAALIAVVAPFDAHSATNCPASAPEAIAKARQSMQSDNPADQKAATECLIVAVAALDAKVVDLIAGKIEFTGAITAPTYLYAKKPDTAGGKQ